MNAYHLSISAILLTFLLILIPLVTEVAFAFRTVASI